MSYSIIAAIGENNELGYKNGLIWHLPKDLKYFRKTTKGKTIIMGRRTFESLPKMLPNRKHIVISNSEDFPEGVVVYHNIEDLINDLKNTNDEVFVIGGASIYKLFLDLSDKLYLTEINETFEEADTYFPEFNKDEFDMEVLDEETENSVSYKHVLYKRKNRI